MFSVIARWSLSYLHIEVGMFKAFQGLSIKNKASSGALLKLGMAAKGMPPVSRNHDTITVARIDSQTLNASKLNLSYPPLLYYGIPC